jgi:demethylmenaquinone methyltransferase/2-methoxy-6-polyprenyl-1,4-benzoquinol methylase|tara:strand:+ start:3760 stop:4512 length:753 start_codon:yes stop_codon:yes gene_type:complete
MSQENNSTQTHFGFRDVNITEKSSMVRGVFDSVAPRYDLMNDLMSGGIHRWWKNILIKRINPGPAMKLLDVGGGTGDIAFKFLEKGGQDVIICDINEEMLKVGRDRALDRAIIEGPRWVRGNAEQLPLKDSSIDTYVTAFCLRNVTHLAEALKEARRVLRPGGHFLCLEFSRVILPSLAKLYDSYSFNVLPLIGQLVANDRDSYQYLAESIRRFPPQEDFAAMIAEAGLDQVSHQNLSGGIAAIHSAWRI